MAAIPFLSLSTSYRDCINVNKCSTPTLYYSVYIYSGSEIGPIQTHWQWNLYIYLSYEHIKDHSRKFRQSLVLYSLGLMNNICSTLLHSSLCPHRRPHRFLLRLEGDSMRPLPPNLERARGGRMSSTTQRIHLNRVWKRSRRMQAALELDATPLEFPKLVPFRLQDKALQHKPEALHACRHLRNPQV